MNNEETKIKYNEDTLGKANPYNDTIKEIYHNCVVTVNTKTKNNQSWDSSESIFLIDSFLDSYKDKKILTCDFKLDNRQYTNDISYSKNIFNILDNIQHNNCKNYFYKYSDDTLSKDLFNIIISHLKSINKTKFSNVSLGFENIKEEVSTDISSGIKNFERNLLIEENKNISDDIDNIEMQDLVFAANKVMYAFSSNLLFIMTYSPKNKNYIDDKVKDVNKAPNISLLVYDIQAKDFFTKHFNDINLYYNNFMQFVYSSNLNLNINNSLGEASKISKYWYTTGVQKVLNDNKDKLQKAKDSLILAELIVKDILAADIDGVDTLEVYPFDRVFLFNKSIFSNFLNNSDSIQIKVAESLLESKISDKNISAKKEFGNNTRYTYEWERYKADLELGKFNLSNKKIVMFDSNVIEPDGKWIDSYNKDTETVINNLLYSFMGKPSKAEKNKISDVLLNIGVR